MPATAAGAPRTEAADLAAWRDVPRLAGRLLLRHWPALLCLFFAQRVAYDLLQDASLVLTEASLPLA